MPIRTGAMSLAYIVSAYQLPDQLARLVAALDSQTCHFYIHVDRKTDDAVYRRIMTRPGFARQRSRLGASSLLLRWFRPCTGDHQGDFSPAHPLRLRNPADWPGLSHQ